MISPMYFSVRSGFLYLRRSGFADECSHFTVEDARVEGKVIILQLYDTVLILFTRRKGFLAFHPLLQVLVHTELSSPYPCTAIHRTTTPRFCSQRPRELYRSLSQLSLSSRNLDHTCVIATRLTTSKSDTMNKSAMYVDHNKPFFQHILIRSKSKSHQSFSVQAVPSFCSAKNHLKRAWVDAAFIPSLLLFIADFRPRPSAPPISSKTFRCILKVRIIRRSRMVSPSLNQDDNLWGSGPK